MLHVMLRVLAAASLCATMGAQTASLVIPPAATARDGTTAGALAGFGRKLRQQILIGPEFLVAARNREFTSITFRRDGGPHPTDAGRAHLRVTLAHAPFTDARAAAEVFASNRGPGEVVAFQGEVTLPASARPANRDSITWTAPHVVTIPLTGFTYVGGVVCIEIDGEPVAGAASSWWGIDVERAGSAGVASVLGHACGTASSTIAKTASVDPWRLRVGSTLRLSAMAQPHAPAALMLGAAALPVPINLGFLGAPNCSLSITPDVFVPIAVGPRPRPQWPGFAHAELHLVNASNYLGAAFCAQWYALEGAGFVTTNGLRLQISGESITQNTAMVTSPPATTSFSPTGSVAVGVVPVMELRYASGS